MYRLVKFPGIKVSKPKIINTQISSKVCSLCGINNVTLIPNLKRGMVHTNMQCKRQQRTHTNVMFSNELAKRRRFQKDKKYFTELLEVFSNTSQQTQALVRNLKPGDVSRIAIAPNLKLDNFHKIKYKNEKCKTKFQKMNASKMENSLYRGNTTTGSDIAITNNSNESTMLEFSQICGKEENKFIIDSKLKDGLSSKNEYTSISSNVITVIDKEIGIQESHEEISEPLSSVPETVINTNLFSISSVDPYGQEHIAEEYEIHQEDSENEKITSETLKTLPMNPLKKEKREKQQKKLSKEELIQEKINELEKKCREKAFNTTLHAYISLCVSCNFLQRGMASLHHYIHIRKMSKKRPEITDIRTFEVLMRGFAAKGNQNKLNEVKKMIASVGLKPSLDVFMLELLCAAHSRKDKTQLVGVIIKSMEDMDYELNDIFIKCNFLGDERNIILNAIREVKPTFEPNVPPPLICYSCSLLEELNEQQGKNENLRSPAEGLITKAQLQTFAEEQFKNEFAFYLKVKSIEKRFEPEGTLEVNRQKLDQMRASWMKDLQSSFHRDVTALEMIRKPYINLLPYLRVLDSKSYIDIMMKEIQRLAEGSETFSPTTIQLYRNLGNQVRQRYIINFKKTHGIIDKTKELYGKYCDWYLNPSINNRRSCNGRQEWQQLIHQHEDGPTVVREDEYWPTTVLVGLGKFLYKIIVGDVMIDVNIFSKTNKQHMLPAFYRVYRQQGVKSVEEIKPHPVISKLLRAAAEEHILFDMTLVPMVSPPLPWSSYQSGGYLTAKTDIIRLPDQALQQRQRLKEAPPQQLYPSLDSLNQLGSIPWRVNKPMLDTVIEVFNNGGSDKLEIPEPPHLCPVAVPVNPSMSKQERYQAYRQRLLLRRQKAEMYSLWCDALYKLSLANHFRDRIFWLPHNMDFRGRVYPCPPHLNHLGADMARSLLCFAVGKPLGATGFDWLKIHLVNLLGTKKRNSIQDRLAYANAIMPKILDSAIQPLTGNKWWMDSEEPWQTLACCMEINAALQHPSGPQNFVSHFPIHQDGSCNGLQHYAALGRDEAGACSVNLMPQELPQDVYSCVAAMVERERVKDSAAGLNVAKELDGFVRRKVIKQTVMTTVYGVTRFGARLQIAKQLKDIDSFPKEYVWPASTYLVGKTFESLREMFTSTREIQDWFTECARLVSQVCNENMEYVTPLGLPVVQYYSRIKKTPDYSMNKFGILQENFPIDMFERPNVMKQKNAFPPNFIHSLDSSHMMLTSIFTEQKGMTFVSVHDCYWTHACTVHIMNQICREQFVALHSQPILEDLSEFMLKRFCRNSRGRMDQNKVTCQGQEKLYNELSQVPRKGTFLLENVLDSIYFFS